MRCAHTWGLSRPGMAWAPRTGAGRPCVTGLSGSDSVPSTSELERVDRPRSRRALLSLSLSRASRPPSMEGVAPPNAGCTDGALDREVRLLRVDGASDWTPSSSSPHAEREPPIGPGRAPSKCGGIDWMLDDGNSRRLPGAPPATEPFGSSGLPSTPNPPGIGAPNSSPGARPPVI